MARIELKRGTTIIAVPEHRAAEWEALGYKKSTGGNTGGRGRKSTTKSTAKTTTDNK